MISLNLNDSLFSFHPIFCVYLHIKKYYNIFIYIRIYITNKIPSPFLAPPVALFTLYRSIIAQLIFDIFFIKIGLSRNAHTTVYI